MSSRVRLVSNMPVHVIILKMVRPRVNEKEVLWSYRDVMMSVFEYEFLKKVKHL